MNVMNTTRIVEEIKKRTEGLLYLSEMDYPINVLCCETEEPIIKHLLKISGKNAAEKVEEVPLSFLFKNYNSLQEGKSPDSNATRYNELINYLTEHLNDVKVLKIGDEEADVFITGAIEGDKYITISTKSLESL
jgi:hypothetical protein